MSWLSNFLALLKASSREEHFMAKIAGEEELENDYIPSSREEGFKYKIAQRLAGSVPADSADAAPGMVPMVGPDGTAEYGTPAFIVNIVKRPAGSGTVTVLDKTADEIIEALKTRSVVVVYDSGNNGLSPGVAEATTFISANYLYSSTGCGSCYFYVGFHSNSPMQFYAASGSDTPVLD